MMTAAIVALGMEKLRFFKSPEKKVLKKGSLKRSPFFYMLTRLFFFFFADCPFILVLLFGLLYNTET